MTTSIAFRLRYLMAVALAVTAGEAIGAAPTAIEEIVMYAIDADTDELMRYTFETDEFIVIGVVEPDAHCEALGWVPAGPRKGMYTVPSAGAMADDLLRIEPFDGSPSLFMDMNLRVTGATYYYDAADGAWVLLMVEHSDDYLFTLNPHTGVIKTVLTDVQNYEGLAIGPDGNTLYAATRTELWTVDLTTLDETKVGDLPGADKTESLEYAFGDEMAAVSVPGVPAAWTQDGLLVGFDDDVNALMIIDPNSGDVVRYPCSFASVDVEGIVFTTKTRDPFGRVVAEPFD